MQVWRNLLSNQPEGRSHERQIFADTIKIISNAETKLIDSKLCRSRPQCTNNRFPKTGQLFELHNQILLTYFVNESITVQLTSCLIGFNQISYYVDNVNVTKRPHPNQSDRRLAIQWYTPDMSVLGRHCIQFKSVFNINKKTYKEFDILIRTF